MTPTHRGEFPHRQSPPGYRPTYGICQITFAPSSVTRNTPSFVTVTTTGRPNTFPSGVTKTGQGAGRALLNGDFRNHLAEEEYGEEFCCYNGGEHIFAPEPCCSLPVTATQACNQCNDRTTEAHPCTDQVHDVHCANVRHGRAVERTQKADKAKRDQHEKDAKEHARLVHKFPFPLVEFY